MALPMEVCVVARETFHSCFRPSRKRNPALARNAVAAFAYTLDKLLMGRQHAVMLHLPLSLYRDYQDAFTTAGYVCCSAPITFVTQKPRSLSYSNKFNPASNSQTWLIFFPKSDAPSNTSGNVFNEVEHAKKNNMALKEYSALWNTGVSMAKFRPNRCHSPGYVKGDKTEENQALKVFRPQQLPVKVLSHLIKAFGRSCLDSVPCVVFDPFAGTGSTAVAARAHGCHFWSNDKDTDSEKVALDFLESTSESW